MRCALKSHGRWSAYGKRAACTDSNRMPPLRTSSTARDPPARAAMTPTPRVPSTAPATPPTSCRPPSKAGTAPRYTTQCPQPHHPLFIPHPHLYPVFQTFFHLTILMSNILTQHTSLRLLITEVRRPPRRLNGLRSIIRFRSPRASPHSMARRPRSDLATSIPTTIGRNTTELRLHIDDGGHSSIVFSSSRIRQDQTN